MKTYGHEEASAPDLHQRATRPREHHTAVQRALTSGDPRALGGPAVLQLQRSAGNEGVSELLDQDAGPARSPVLGVVQRGGGEPLDAATRGRMESRLGHDFSDVRVHTDQEASRSAESVSATAYTVGTDIVFQSGHYQPGSEQGDRTLAHELTHVVQQRSGPVDGTPTAGGISVSDPSDRFEQEAARTAERFTSPERRNGPDSTGPSAAPSVQRQAAEEVPEESLEEEPEKQIQGIFVQRQGTEETPEEVPG